MNTLTELALAYAEALKEESFATMCYAESGLRQDELAVRAAREKTAEADFALRAKAAQEAFLPFTK